MNMKRDDRLYLVQSCLLGLGILLLASLVTRSPGQTRGCLLLDFNSITKLLFAELVNLLTRFGHNTLCDGAPVRLKTFGQHPDSK